MLETALHVLTRTRSRMLEGKEKTKSPTVHQQAELLELCNGLSRSLLELRGSQRIYMPGLEPLLDDENPEDTKLWLPSELSQDQQVEWCLPGLPALEFCFRYAQANDCLAEIRRLRRMLQSLADQNSKHPSQAQKSVTRTKGLFNLFHAKVRRVTLRYRRSYQAMLALDPSQKFSPGWMQRFQKLEDGDLRGPGRELDDHSEGTFQPSWIWLVPRLTDGILDGSNASTNPPPGLSDTTTGPTVASTPHPADHPEVANSMRVHWARCQARADRYEEEALLTVEDMGWTLRYFEWKRTLWLSLQSRREQAASPPPIEVRRGLYAYANRQVHVYETLMASFLDQW